MREAALTSTRCVAGAIAGLLVAAPATAAPLKLKLTNHRGSPVLNFRLQDPGATADSKNMLKGPLLPGDSIDLTFNPPKGKCVFNVRGVFEDGQPVQGDGFDLCKDHNLTLVE
jgi:hypothetical protein